MYLLYVSLALNVVDIFQSCNNESDWLIIFISGYAKLQFCICNIYAFAKFNLAYPKY